MTFNPLIFTDDYLRVRAVPTCHTSTYVFCHGQDQQGGDWQFIVEPLRKLGHCNHIAFIFPYLDYSGTTSGGSISKNEALVQKIVKQEIVNGCDPSRIAVGGYNEGLEVALLATLADENKIGGVLGVTDGLRLINAVREIRKPANAMTPVFVLDRSGKGDNAGEKLLSSFGQPIGAFVDGSKHDTSQSQPVSSKVCS
jgi:predicted esterase